MTLITNIKNNDIVNFDMIAPGIFGAQYKAALVSTIAPYSVASLIDPSIQEKHANFYPFFKESVDNVNDPTIYNYLILQLDKTKSALTVIGIPWINADSLKTIGTRQATFIIQDFQEYQRAAVLDFLNNLNVKYTFIVQD